MKKLNEYFRAHRWSVALVVIALVAAVPLMAFRLADETLNACYIKGSGVLYLVGQAGTAAECRSKQHTMVTWNIQGPPGPAGPPGPGVTNLQTISQDFTATEVGNGGIAQGSLNCPDGTTLISGGAQIRSGNGGIPPYIAIVDSYPSGNGWAAIGRETTIPVPPAFVAPGGWKVTIFAWCGTQTT